MNLYQIALTSNGIETITGEKERTYPILKTKERITLFFLFWNDDTVNVGVFNPKSENKISNVVFKLKSTTTLVHSVDKNSYSLTIHRRKCVGTVSYTACIKKGEQLLWKQKNKNIKQLTQLAEKMLEDEILTGKIKEIEKIVESY